MESGDEVIDNVSEQEIEAAADKIIEILSCYNMFDREKIMSIVLSGYCRICYCENPRCQCWNDE